MQINEKTNLNVDYKEIKFGRKVEKLEFTFELKKSQLPVVKIEPSNDVEKINSQVSNSISLIDSELSGQTKSLISQYVKEKGQDYVEASIAYAKKKCQV